MSKIINVKKRVSIILSMILVVIVFAAGCGNANKTISYTFNVETGDDIVVSLDASDGYSMTPDVPFAVSKDDEVLSQGTFITADYYTYYVDAAKNDANAVIIDEGTKGDCSYVMWNYNDTEYDCVVMINGTNTGLVIGNDVSEESAKECFDRLEIKVKE
ncbi:MAG: hypothetical protein K6B67_04895 [Lachnospiraceae bacterium]|nr:hypothetical protein [Lachnospiraceae bacterium]